MAALRTARELERCTALEQQQQRIGRARVVAIAADAWTVRSSGIGEGTCASDAVKRE
jgi:hypothetical protein